MRKPLLTNRIEAHIENTVVNNASDYTAQSQTSVSGKLIKKGLLISFRNAR